MYGYDYTNVYGYYIDEIKKRKTMYLNPSDFIDAYQEGRGFVRVIKEIYDSKDYEYFK